MREVGNGRYQLVRELGRGGMGAVWLGLDTMLGREVAVKELMVPGGVPHDERAVYQERVLREARIASRLADPAVVTVYDLIKEHDQTYIVMELIKGPTLTELVDRDGPLSTAAVAALAGQLLSALEAAHESGVVHRDVKPGNVMVPVKGSAKLTDFGIAQALDDPRLTATGSLIGSPAYMSPERVSGGAASPAWDMWALGATLFFAAEGRGAFERDSTSATILAVMTERPEPRLTSGPLVELIMGLLEPDPGLRLRAPQAQQLINRIAGQSQPVDLPTQRVSPSPRPVKRGRAMAIGVGLSLPVLVGAVVFLVLNQGSLFGLTGGRAGSGNTTTSTTVPAASSRAMQPVLTVGPDGDIKSELLGAYRESCINNWIPAKGVPDPKSRVGCYGPHDVEWLDSILVNAEPEKDVPYPSLEELARRGGSECTQKFLSAEVTGQNKEDTLRYWVIVPTATAWQLKTTSGGYRTSDRIIYCFVGKADGGKLTDPVVADK
ncbi:serine/threonine protein kinase [Kibdelosporangium banguiense]|uniref:non-specific serine/threonine protein kinase n=1 Tax=Kibdelosporangium banguiense TaxID=1365924 RepID=A0ABS4TRF9_9PSEU|nr:serine/threonine-protein kinase [Kibdelosporangium banguiense]MBP2326574.1 serine/threonine protein kinase [Kibdelosporangium banguiense]